MKAKNDPRHLERIRIMKALYSQSFQKKRSAQIKTPESEVLKNLKRIDKLVMQNAPAWPIEQLPPVDLAILRLATWELIYKDKKEPYKAVVDEAVEIAKEFGTDQSASFVNGVLGSIIKSKLKNQLISN